MKTNTYQEEYLEELSSAIAATKEVNKLLVRYNASFYTGELSHHLRNGEWSLAHEKVTKLLSRYEQWNPSGKWKHEKEIVNGLSTVENFLIEYHLQNVEFCSYPYKWTHPERFPGYQPPGTEGEGAKPGPRKRGHRNSKRTDYNKPLKCENLFSGLEPEVEGE